MQINVHNTVTPYCEYVVVCCVLCSRLPRCQPGFYGRRCEFQDLMERFLPSMQQQKIEAAALSAGVAILIVLVFVGTVAFIIYKRFVHSQ